MKYTSGKPSFYGVGKAILNNGMTVNKWWEAAEWNRQELINFFGIEPLKRGLQNSVANGEHVPEKVYEQFPEFINIK